MELKVEDVCESLCQCCSQIRPAKRKKIELDFWDTGSPELMEVYNCVVCDETILIKSAKTYAKEKND